MDRTVDELVQYLQQHPHGVTAAKQFLSLQSAKPPPENAWARQKGAHLRYLQRQLENALNSLSKEYIRDEMSTIIDEWNCGRGTRCYRCDTLLTYRLEDDEIRCDGHRCPAPLAVQWVK